MSVMYISQKNDKSAHNSNQLNIYTLIRNLKLLFGN